MKVGEPHQFKWLVGVIVTVFVLNVVDGVLTILWVSTKQAREANPLLARALGLHPVLFIVIKIALVGMGSYLLWRHRKRAVAVVGIFVAFIAYYWVMVMHVSVMNVGLIRAWFGR